MNVQYTTANLCSVIVPVYNEELTIENVIRELFRMKSYWPLQIIVVESNSTDTTRIILKRLKAKYNFELVFQDTPKGKGSAFIEGLKCAKGEIISIVDGDNEYRIQDLSLLLTPIISNQFDFVLGNRHVRGAPMRTFPGHKIRSAYYNLGHKFFTGLFNLLYRTKLRDPATMWKVFKHEFILNYTFEGQRFEIDWEIMSLLTRRKAKITEIPIEYSSRGKKEGKKIRSFRDPIEWLYWIIRFRLKKIQSKEVMN